MAYASTSLNVANYRRTAQAASLNYSDKQRADMVKPEANEDNEKLNDLVKQTIAASPETVGPFFFLNFQRSKKPNFKIQFKLAAHRRSPDC